MSLRFRRQTGGVAPVLLLLPLALIASCDDSRITEGSPRIAVSPQAVAFKTLNVDETDTQVLTISNIGTASLRINSLQIEGADVFGLQEWNGSGYSQGSFPDAIAHPGGTDASAKDLVLAFTPSQEGDFSADLIISSDDEDNEVLRVPLTGSCSVPDITVDPPALGFGGVLLSSSSALMLTIKNEGASDLVVPADELSLLSGDDESPFFWMASDMRIGAGEQQIMQVLYSPEEVRLDPVTHEPLPDEDTLLVYSNDPDENPVEVPLSGFVDDNLPPLVALRIVETTKLDGTPLDDPCDIATSDTAKFEASILDPEGDFLQPSNLTWTIERRPLGSQRGMIVPNDTYTASFKPDMYGEYTVCVKAADPQGNVSTIDPELPCGCAEANAKPVETFDCQCIAFTAIPREDIRIELTWGNIGPDLDLHLVAPAGQYCSPTRECRFNPNEVDPDWSKFACVELGVGTVCREPNCDPVLEGCLEGQECFDDDDAGPNPPTCYWRRCSGTDCYWDSRNPDWGQLGDESDDPLLAIDCTHSCRAENINLNHPEQGIYRIMVNYFEYDGNTTATVRIFFKGDLAPSAEYESVMTQDCDTWNVGYITWTDPDDHPVTYLDDNHSELCCE